MSTNNNTTPPRSHNTARDRIKLVIGEGLAEVGLQYDMTISTHFVTPGVMIFQILICKPKMLGLHEVARLVYEAFSADITIQSIGHHGIDHYAINLRIDVQAALADVPTNEAA